MVAIFDKQFTTTDYIFFAYCSDGGYTGFGGTYEDNGDTTGSYIGNNWGKYKDKCLFRFRNVDTVSNSNRIIYWEAIGI